MVFCSLKDAYGESWKNNNANSMTPCQSSNFTTNDPYFDDQMSSGIINKLEKLENAIEYFTKQSSIPNKPPVKAGIYPKKEKFSPSGKNNTRLENIIHYTLVAIFGALVVENIF